MPGTPHKHRVLREEAGLGFGHWIHSSCCFPPRKQGARSWAGSQDGREGKELGLGRGKHPGRAHVTHLRLEVSVDRQARGARLLPRQRGQGPDKRVGGVLLGGGLVGRGHELQGQVWVGGCRKEEAQVGGWEGAAELRDPQGCKGPEAAPGRAVGGPGLGGLV